MYVGGEFQVSRMWVVILAESQLMVNLLIFSYCRPGGYIGPQALSDGDPALEC